MIRLIDAEKVYDNGTRALKGVSFTVDDGEFVFLVGPSGSGKSTIIKLMTGEVVNGINTPKHSAPRWRPKSQNISPCGSRQMRPPRLPAGQKSPPRTVKMPAAGCGTCWPRSAPSPPPLPICPAYSWPCQTPGAARPRWPTPGRRPGKPPCTGMPCGCSCRNSRPPKALSSALRSHARRPPRNWRAHRHC